MAAARCRQTCCVGAPSRRLQLSTTHHVSKMQAAWCGADHFGGGGACVATGHAEDAVALQRLAFQERRRAGVPLALLDLKRLCSVARRRAVIAVRRTILQDGRRKQETVGLHTGSRWAWRLFGGS